MKWDLPQAASILIFGILICQPAGFVQAQPAPPPAESLDDLFDLLDNNKPAPPAQPGTVPVPAGSSTSPDTPAPASTTQAAPAPATPPASVVAPPVMDPGLPPRDVPAGKLQFNFRFAAWDDVLRELASLSGLTLDMQSTPPGSFSYFDKEPKTPVEALDILNGYLIQRGYLLVRRDNFLIVAKIENGIPANLIPTIDLEDLQTRGANELVRVVFDLDTARAEDLVEDVRSQLGPQGDVVAMGATNRLVVSGLALNVRRVDKLLNGVRLASGPNELNFRAFQLKYIPAGDAEPTIRALLGVTTGFDEGSSRGSSRGSSSSDPRAQFMQMMADRMRGGDSGGRGDWGGGDRGRPPESGRSSSSSTTSSARITVDTRTNSLLIAATLADLNIVEQAIEQIDLPAKDGSNAFQQTSGPVLRVYEIEDGELDEISETLTLMVPGVMINVDDRADVLHVVADEDKQREVSALISTITGKGTGSEMSLVPLFNQDAEWVALSLTNLFAAEANPPIIQSDLYGTHLIVRGSSDQLLQVKSLILQLSESSRNIGPIPGLNSGPVRYVPLEGINASEFLPLLERMWNSSGRSPLRIISPQAPAAPANEQPAAPSEKPAEDSSVQQSSRSSIFTRFVVLQTEEDEQPETIQEEATPEQPAAARDDQGISIAVFEDQLVISGANEADLNELQSMLARLLQQYASRTQWSIYYLRVAEASATADMLRQLFPDIEVASTTVTTSSRFGSSSSSAPETTTVANPVRIVPETRSNALYITGPPEKIREIENVLRILDNNELPESYRDRVARSIPVQYASVEDVAEVLKDVFADRLPQPTGGRRGPNGEEVGGGVSAGELTIGVDSQTSQIIVSANESLYREVEALVLSLDESARLARRTVRVVNLEYANAADVQSTLGTLIPKVSFSTSSSGNRVSSSRGGPSGGESGRSDDSSRRSDGSSGSSSDDSRRRFFEEMMRRRSEGGGDRGGSPFGGGGPPFGGGGPPFGGGFRGR
ncbi:MAG: hypothetical protein KDA78_00425 [Planctomycetaceae bacterium]|nr:hypothetical protein [Planctomycetaceae bacterium]